MKKLIMSLLLLVPMVTGCVNIDTQVTLNSDKSAQVVTSLNYSGDLSNRFDKQAALIAANYNNYLDNTYKVIRDNGKNLSTILASKKVDNIQYTDLDLSKLGLISNLPDGKFIGIKKNFFITSYNIDCTFDYAKEAEKYSALITPDTTNQKQAAEEAPLNPEYFNQYVDANDTATNFNTLVDNKETAANTEEEQTTNNELATSFSIQVPYFASYNNADSVKGNVYIWQIKKDAPTTIKLQYVEYSGWAISILFFIGIGLLVLLARKILKHDSQKRMDNNNNIV